MKDRMERLVSFPFSIGCVSQSSVAVGESQPKTKPHSDQPPPMGEGEMKSSFTQLLPLPRTNISAGLQKLIKGFKSLSQLFVVYKDQEVDDDDDEPAAEMEIGFPTDVQHVAHIGWDGFNNVGAMKSWDQVMRSPAEFLPLSSSLSIRQFEIAMAAQAAEHAPTSTL